MAMLTRGDATRREAFAVTDAVDVIDYRNFWIARQEEVGVHRVRRPAGIDGAYRRDEGPRNRFTSSGSRSRILSRSCTADDMRKPEMVKGCPQPAMLRPDLQGM